MSAERGERLSLLRTHERVVVLEQTAKRAHERVDEIKIGTAKELETIHQGLGEVSKDIKELLAWKNRALGWAAAAIFISSLLGGAVATVLVKAIFTSAQAVERPIGPPRK
jgi:hypothetical protein